MVSTDNEADELLRAKFNTETAQIRWHELQRFFAQGVTIAVAAELDLVEVAFQFARDNKPQVEQWLAHGTVGSVTDEQATGWYDCDEILWSVIVRPWVLVQLRNHKE